MAIPDVFVILNLIAFLMVLRKLGIVRRQLERTEQSLNDLFVLLKPGKAMSAKLYVLSNGILTKWEDSMAFKVDESGRKVVIRDIKDSKGNPAKIDLSASSVSAGNPDLVEFGPLTEEADGSIQSLMTFKGPDGETEVSVVCDGDRGPDQAPFLLKGTLTLLPANAVTGSLSLE